MNHEGSEKRTQKRTDFEPYDTGTFLEFQQGGNHYRFSLLDRSLGGMGMIVKNSESEVLEKIQQGVLLKMKYVTLEKEIPLNFEVKHVTPIKKGRWEGHYHVGLRLITDQD